MEPKDNYFHIPATGLHLEPDESSPHHIPLFLSHKLILPFMPQSSRWSSSLTKILCAFITSSMHAIYSTHLIILDLIILIIFCEEYKF
jgi:hypothetical protein